MNGAAAAATEQGNGLTSPSSKPANGMSVVRNGSTASEDIEDEEVRAELEEEVQDLRDDRTYHDFIHNVVDNKKIAEEDENSDEDFIVEGEEDGEEGEEKEQGEDGSDGDESNLSDFDEDEKVAAVNCAGEHGDVVKIPKEALRDAEKRFPHFWRTKHAIKTQYREDDYEEEQDPDYEPDNDKEAANLDDTQDEETAEGAVLET